MQSGRVNRIFPCRYHHSLLLMLAETDSLVEIVVGEKSTNPVSSPRIHTGRES